MNKKDRARTTACISSVAASRYYLIAEKRFDRLAAGVAEILQQHANVMVVFGRALAADHYQSRGESAKGHLKAL